MEDERVIIPEEELIQLAKGVKRKDEDGKLPEKQLESTLRAESDHSDLVALAYGRETWIELFDIFLRSSESRNSKPLKLLLLALERNLIRNPSQAIKDHLIVHIISRTWQVISLKDDGESAVKPSLQALRHFICKNVIRAQDIILIISRDLDRAAESTEFRETQDPSLPVDSPESTKYVKYTHRFLCKILSWLRHPDVAPITGRLIGVFCSSFRAWSLSWEESPGLTANGHVNQPIWLSALKSSCQKQPELLDLFAVHVFPEVIKQDRAGIPQFAEVSSLKRLTVDNLATYGLADLHISLLLLRAIKENGTFDTVDKETIEFTASNLISHADSQIRLLAFSITVQASAPKEPLSSTVLSSLVLALPNHHVEIDPKTRQDNLALIKRFCFRLVGVIKSFNKEELDSEFTRLVSDRTTVSFNSSTGANSEEASLQRHLSFFLWYRDFLLHELSPTASYQRHVVSLKVVEFVMSNDAGLLLYRESSNGFIGEGRDSYSKFGHDLMTSLLTLGNMGQFDPGKKLRKLFPVARQRLTLACTRAAERAQSTARADHADGYGRLYALSVGLRTVPDQMNPCGDYDRLALCRLMTDLDDRIHVARTDIHTAVKTASLHGFLIAARYLILDYNLHHSTHELDPTQCRTWREYSHLLLRIAFDVWEAVKHILCADAPEGFEADTVDDQNPVGTKDMLSFCWRALKESSTLMHAMIAGSKGAPIVRALQYQHYRTFGELAFTELAELRHRGAFSTVSQTFAECCIRCMESKDPETRLLPKEWYQVRLCTYLRSPAERQQKTLLCIQQRASALTRRSAGLPAMITGILSATPKEAFFDTVIQDLQAIARGETDIDSKEVQQSLPQVHAFNCLKDIFTDARFNASVEQHMSTSLELAVHALESDRWAVRNCGLMLMKALITRMNDGTNTLSKQASSASRSASSLVYDRFPNVPDLILRLLTHNDVIDSKMSHQGFVTPDSLLTQAQHVFPALEIIEQSGIPKKYHTEIQQASWSHLEGPVWAIRDKAAKALSYLPKSNAIETEIKRCLQSPWSTQNSLHGYLLYLRYLAIRLQSDTEGLQVVFDEILEHMKPMLLQNHCPITRSSYVTLLAGILEAIGTADLELGPSPTAEERNWKPSTPLELVSEPSSSNWQLFVQYLDQACPGRPAYALEDAAKRRCRPLAKSLNKSVEPGYPKIDISQTIFADSGISGGPHTPENADRTLRMTGRYLYICSQELADSPTSFGDMLGSWSRALQLAINDHAEVSTRQAAVDSLSDFFSRPQHWDIRTDEAASVLPLFLILYDSLLDDDEDVRLSAAATVSKLLTSMPAQDNSKTVRIPLMVPAASHYLLDFLKSRYRKLTSFWIETVRRMIGTHSRPHPEPEFSSPRLLLSQLKPEDTTLFVEEKQNLYIDEAKESGIWVGVLLAMDTNAIDLDTLRKLETWATEGIDALIDVASTEIDGPLGWTWKLEVYTLGVQILYAAQVLMHLARDESLGVDGSILRARLEKMLEVGEKSRVNGAWMQIISKSLE
ncbi:MAG: hypothetical protein Q9169_000040 [Polycauliona sp. 2 TL-2023]